MVRRYVVSAVTLVSLLVACGNDPLQFNRCIPGTTQECACPGGGTAVQTCMVEGTFGTCACGGDLDAWEPVTDTGFDAEPSDAPEQRDVGGDADSSDDSGPDDPSVDTWTDASSNQPPSVELEGPVHGAFVTGAVRVRATANDDRRVVGVRFLVDDEMVWDDTAVPFEFDLDTSSYAEGPHSIRVTARDEDGLEGRDDASVTFDHSPPSLSVVQPQHDEYAQGRIAYEARANDNYGIARVDWRFDGRTLGTFTEPPFGAILEAGREPLGRHTFVVTATDLAGLQRSATVNIEIVELPLLGACLGLVDYAIATSSDLDRSSPGAQTATTYAQDCGLGCLGDPDSEACAVECVQDETGLSRDCASCYADAVDCAINNCLAPCAMDPSSWECAACRDDFCRDDFEFCSGID